MRKSERLRLLELNMLRMQFEMEALQAAIQLLLEQNNVKAPEMDAGKWYNAKFSKN